MENLLSLRQAWLGIVASILVTLALLLGCNATIRLPTPAPAATAAVQTVRQPTPSPASTPRGQRAQVTHIVDGDTIYVTFGGATHRVRYILINTPETDEPFGAAATAANQALVGGQTVYLVKDKSETDRYGRLLRYVYLPDGTFVNAELVRQGFAQVAIYPPDVSKKAEIQAVEAEARLAKRGLWAAGPVAFGPASAAVRVKASLYRGPGLGYPVAGEVRAGQRAGAGGTGCHGQWLQVAGRSVDYGCTGDRGAYESAGRGERDGHENGQSHYRGRKQASRICRLTQRRNDAGGPGGLGAAVGAWAARLSAGECAGARGDAARVGAERGQWVQLRVWESDLEQQRGGYPAVLIGAGRSGGGADGIELYPRRGYSLMAEDVLALMDHLGIDKADLVGWSDGGIIGLDLGDPSPRAAEQGRRLWRQLQPFGRARRHRRE